MPLTILLVDDQPEVIEIWRRHLAPLEANILTATSVEEAITQMRRIPPPDFVLLDLILPPHGPSHVEETITALRAFNPALTIVAISGREKDDILRMVANVRVEAAINKHEAATQSALLRVVLEALEKSKKSSQVLSQVGELINKLTPKE